MIGPLETFILVAVFYGDGAKEGLRYKTDTQCYETKYHLMELWVGQDEDTQISSMDEALLIKRVRHAEIEDVYMLECKNEINS